jgi:Protein of unknown function (DUF1592)/Protein of unknown function (DUF1588)/Protein of unknown function (DUF1587)/Protein of unknown function (DUF1585)/Protein of unknown function (DUF1595)/Ca-dependent carbohydrate-binding module xylan-binding/Planctomycete cytochrome C
MDRCLLLPILFVVAFALSDGKFAVCADNSAGQKNQPAAASFTNDVVPFLAKHCYACHGNGKSKGDLVLDRFKDDESVVKNRKIWEDVKQMVQNGEMPPKEKPRPAAAEIDGILKSLDAVLGKIDCHGKGDAGRVTLHRLNRSEYNNTIRDLVGVDFKPAADFPNDDVGYGFDNIGDVLSMSPLLFEQYLSAAETILDKAIVVADLPQPAKNRVGGLRFSPRSAGSNRKMVGNALTEKGDLIGEGFYEEGDYIVRVEAFGMQVGDQPVKAKVSVLDVTKEFEIKAKQAEPQTLELKVRLRTGTTRVTVSFLNPYTDPKIQEAAKKDRQLVVRSIVFDGPYNPPPPKLPDSHKLLMAHKEGVDQREAAREILARFATRAFRRPVKAEEVERFLKLYDKSAKSGERFENRIRLTLSGVLVSPHFLFRVELDPPNAKTGAVYPINEFELASRLSYFFWSSMPDDELFALAAQGNLRKNLDAQVKRLLKDPKSAAFVQNFAGQWLTIRKLDTINPDPKVFPQFDKELRDAMRRETELFFDAILREDHSILDFLDADFTFVNERLAKHYGIAGVKGSAFKRVKLPPERGGVLTQASILTLTSNSTRTAPVKRGKWVLEQILNTPPPPPPPDVPNLPQETELTGSLRQVMEQHRANPVCASCHERMDPIGFAFENFDAIGRWRDKDGKYPIDSSGVLPDGKTFKGPGELKTILKDKKDLFGRCLTEKLLTYALGRGVEDYDKCAVDKILGVLDKNDYRFSVLLMETIRSEPFQMRTATGKKQ